MNKFAFALLVAKDLHSHFTRKMRESDNIEDTYDETYQNLNYDYEESWKYIAEKYHGKHVDAYAGVLIKDPHLLYIPNCYGAEDSWDFWRGWEFVVVGDDFVLVAKTRYKTSNEKDNTTFNFYMTEEHDIAKMRGKRGYYVKGDRVEIKTYEHVDENGYFVGEGMLTLMTREDERFYPNTNICVVS